MTKVEIPLDIDHTCEKAPQSYNVLGDTIPAAKENRCPGCCYERGYLDARPWLKRPSKAKKAT